MSVTLPSELAWVLNILGFMWPEADEDKLRASAQAWRNFGTELVRVNQDARLVAAQVTAENSGDSIDSFQRYWNEVGGNGGDFDRAKEAADHMAMALEGMALLVEGVKGLIIAQLGLLSIEIIADQVAAPETLGASEALMAGEIIVTRGIVRRIIQEGIHRIGREIVQALKGRVKELLRRILANGLRRAVGGAVSGGGLDLARQGADIYIFHSRTHLDAGELATSVGAGALLGGASSVGSRRVVVRNGYRYTFDSRGRPHKVEGWLVANPTQGRNTKAQLAAGGEDRRPKTDQGGHWIGRRFDGPLNDFNHFAQDGNFNNGEYKKLENKWQKALDAGYTVHVEIKADYPGASVRPSQIQVTFRIGDGPPQFRRFFNEPGGMAQ